MNKFDLPDRSYADLFDAIKGWVEGQDRAESLFFSGSIANGDADEFSDLDFVIIAEDLDFYPTLLKEARTVIDHIETVVLENRLHPIASISILSLITEKWHRVDLAFGSSTSGILIQRLVPILDPKKHWVEIYANTGDKFRLYEKIEKKGKLISKLLGGFSVDAEEIFALLKQS